MRFVANSMLAVIVSLSLSACASSSPFLSGSDAPAATAAQQAEDRKVVAPDIGDAAKPCEDPGLPDIPASISLAEQRAYAHCSDDKRARAVAGVRAWQREFAR